MTVELRPEDQAAMQAIVNNGHFPSVADAIHAAVQSFTEEHEEWLSYVRESIHQGLADLEAGRVMDGGTFFQNLRALEQSTD